MNDIQTVTQTYEQHAKLLAEANSLNKAAVFEALVSASITSVIVNFDGEGDSGQIQDVCAYKGDATVALPETTIRWRRGWIGEEPQDLDSPLEEAIRDLCWDYLSDEHGGWENNDGGFGEFTLDVSKREVQLEFSARYTDTTNYSHTF